MDLADLRRLVDAFEASDWNEIHLTVDGVEVHLSAAPGGLRPAPPATAPPAAAPPAAASPAAAATAPPAAAAAAPPAASAITESPTPGVAACVVGAPFAAPGSAIGAVPAPPGPAGEPVCAPSPGIFWRSPAPGQPPFVEVGTRVEPEAVVCIVELMKLMNRVSAGRAGIVTAIPVGNGEPVEKGDPIVYIQSDLA
jgi:biotin carboxyl carrier protein